MKPRNKCATKYCRNTRAKNRRICNKCKSRKWRANNPLLAAYYNKRAHANKMHREFTLTVEQFSEVWKPKMSIDRINNNLGYIPGNVQTLSISENSRKGTQENYCSF